MMGISGIYIKLLCVLALGLLPVNGCDLLKSGGDDGEITYTISFSPGEGGGAAPANMTTAAGSAITLPNQGGITAPEGKAFDGWKSRDVNYRAGDSFTVNGDTVFTARWRTGGGEDSSFIGFYNSPAGRVDQNGLLTIRNSIAKETLLFSGTLDGENYIGTVSSLGSVNIKLPEERFYTIVAVEKENYKERREQASQYSVLTYYSNSMAYFVMVSPSSTKVARRNNMTELLYYFF
jgi:hypothetical protein